MTTILLFSFSCSLQTLIVGRDETNPFTLLLFIVFLHFPAAHEQTTRMTEDGAQARWAARPPPTTAHHLRSGILLLCESYSYACRTGTLMVFWKVGKLFLCTFADFHISREREKESLRVCEASSTPGGKTARFWARPITFLQLSYIEKQLLFLVKFGETIAEWHQ